VISSLRSVTQLSARSKAPVQWRPSALHGVSIEASLALPSLGRQFRYSTQLSEGDCMEQPCSPLPAHRELVSRQPILSRCCRCRRHVDLCLTLAFRCICCPPSAPVWPSRLGTWQITTHTHLPTGGTMAACALAAIAYDRHRERIHAHWRQES